MNLRSAARLSLAVLVLLIEGCGGSSSPGNYTATPPSTMYTIGGTVSGLIGTGLVLQLNGGSQLNIATSGTFTFSTSIASGSAYTVSVASQPVSPGQTCVLADASGTVGSAPVDNVVLTCAAPPARFAYVGTHNGIYCYVVDATSGGLTGLANPICDSGSLAGVATDPRGQFLYATDQVAGSIRAYQIDQSTGALTALAGTAAPAGVNPVWVAVDPLGRFLYAANYGSNNVSAYAISSATGALTPVAGSPFATGTGPGSVTVDPSGSFLYTANNGSANISAFAIDPTSGALTPVTGSPYPTAAGVTMNVAIDPMGHFAFVSNAAMASDWANEVYAFTINGSAGTLSSVSGSPFADCPQVAGSCSPSGLAVDTSGAFLYVTNGSANTISGYSIDPTTGGLTPLAGSPFAAAGYPYEVTANGGYLYVSDDGTPSSISIFAIDTETGALSQITGSPVAAAPAGSAYEIAIAP